MRITSYRTILDENEHNILLKEKAVNYNGDYLDTAGKMADMICDVFKLHTMAEEYVYMIAMNTRCKPLGIFELSHGNVCSSPLGAREIMIRAVLCAASSYVILHNHPSKDVTPSDVDIKMTKQIKAVSDLMGIQILDHIIVGDYKKYFSFHENKLL